MAFMNRAADAHAGDPIAEAFKEETRARGSNTLDVYFLAFLKRFARFGYFSCGPITVDVRLIEDILDRTSYPAMPGTPDYPNLGDELVRFSHVLMEELRRSGRNRLDELHYLMAFMRCGEGLPARVFGELGVTPEQVEASFKAGGDAAPAPREKLYSPEDAAEYLGVHVQTVRSWIRSGRLSASRLAGQRVLRIRASALDSLLEPIDATDVD
jgi:excisionase family DNA binding protein